MTTVNQHEFIDAGDTEEMLATYFDVGWLHSEIDWIKQEMEDLETENLKLRAGLKKQNGQFVADLMEENERLKRKVNQLLEKGFR